MVLEGITIEAIILAFCGFIGVQTFRMNGCIKRIEGHIKGMNLGSN